MKKSKFFYLLICLTIVFITMNVIAQNLETRSGENEIPSEDGEPKWQCEFGWSPLSFNCFPVEKDTSTDILSEEVKKQAIVIEAIREKEAEIKQRETALNKRQEELRSLEQRIERKLEEIKKIQQEIETARKQKKEEDQKDLGILVKMYETMDPLNAAAMINNMDQQTAVSIILRMNPRKASALLQATEPQVATEISEMIARIKANRVLAETL